MLQGLQDKGVRSTHLLRLSPKRKVGNRVRGQILHDGVQVGKYKNKSNARKGEIDIFRTKKIDR